MNHYPLDDAVGIPSGVCVTLSSKLNADCVGYLPSLLSVIPGLTNQGSDSNLPLPLLARVAVDNEIMTRARSSRPFFVGKSILRFLVF